MVLATTPDAVYRTPTHPFDDVERVLDAGAVRQLIVADGSPAVFAATGLYWPVNRLGVKPRGTRPAPPVEDILQSENL